MSVKKLRGMDGELLLAYKNVVFAYARSFEAELVEKTVLAQASELGTHEIVAGYKATLRLNEVTIENGNVIKEILSGLNAGLMPQLSFRGFFRRNDGFDEGLDLEGCCLIGKLDLLGLIGGFVWELNLSANILTEKQIKQFQRHGSNDA